ncbi:MAG: SIS domain-containing protein [Angustibacter sp.]
MNTAARCEAATDLTDDGARHRYRSLEEHLDDLATGLADLAQQADELDRWARHLVGLLDAPPDRRGRLLIAGNGGSAAEAQHLSAELVGRFEGERRPLSALVLHGDSSTVTAVVNDYGADEVFARQVEAHGRPGDVLLLLSTSGRSPNLLRAAERARRLGVQVWALTGPAPHPLAGQADRLIPVNARSVSSIQEVHLVAVHALCAAVERELAHQDTHRTSRLRTPPATTSPLSTPVTTTHLTGTPAPTSVSVPAPAPTSVSAPVARGAR